MKDTGIAGVVALAVLVSLGGGLALAATQSLAEVARKEEERRKAVKETSKVLTNKDLVPVPAVAQPPVPTPVPGVDGVTPIEAGKDATATGPDALKVGTEPVKDQAYWSSRLKELQSQLARNETFAVAMQSRINALANEYTNQGDGVQQLAIDAERKKAIAELNQLNKEIADGKQAIADFQEEARRSGVPPGWLR